MQDKRTDRVYITRGTAGETIDGKPRAPRVYITGPHLGTPLDTGTYSSTEDRSKASTFSRADAELLLSLGKWRHLLPEIEDADA